ncbi:MAG: glycosyltransferase family 39 protein, partial [Vicinamibacteria bacterium]|nr:glycosyltransferase family 39 protein [Vicinamibacteria bacterium]
MRLARRVLSWLVGILAFDLLGILITERSLMMMESGRTSVSGFLVRSLLLGVLFTLRVVRLADPEQRWPWGRMALCLLLIPTLLQFQFAGGRINGDGVMYYVYVHSAWKDFDLDLANEYAHYGLLQRGDISVPTKTGLRRSIFSVGPAVAWAPFFWAGEGAGRIQRAFGFEVDLSGYGPVHRNAVALGSLLYGFFAILLIERLLRRYFNAAVATSASLLVWGATFLHWYMVQQPTYAHAPSAFATTLLIWLWLRGREQAGVTRYLLLGLTTGVAMSLRWQNGIFL